MKKKLADFCWMLYRDEPEIELHKTLHVLSLSFWVGSSLYCVPSSEEYIVFAIKNYDWYRCCNFTFFNASSGISRTSLESCTSTLKRLKAMFCLKSLLYEVHPSNHPSEYTLYWWCCTPSLECLIIGLVMGKSHSLWQQPLLGPVCNLPYRTCTSSE